MIDERNHLFGERPIALGLLRNGRSAHRLIIDIVYYQVKRFLPVDSVAPVENSGCVTRARSALGASSPPACGKLSEFSTLTTGATATDEIRFQATAGAPSSTHMRPPLSPMPPSCYGMQTAQVSLNATYLGLHSTGCVKLPPHLQETSENSTWQPTMLMKADSHAGVHSMGSIHATHSLTQDASSPQTSATRSHRRSHSLFAVAGKSWVSTEPPQATASAPRTKRRNTFILMRAS